MNFSKISLFLLSSLLGVSALSTTLIFDVSNNGFKNEIEGPGDNELLTEGDLDQQE